MCGIAGFHIRDKYSDKLSGLDLNRLVDGLLLGIEPRGKDATGYVAVDRKGKTHFEKRDVQAEQFITTRLQIPAGVKTVLLHTRATTKGSEKNNENNHPVEYKGVYATHNGMIRNDDELFADLGIERPAEVDSCIVPVMGSLAGGLDKLPEHLRTLQGTYALAVIDPKNNPNETLLVRGASSPLYWIDATWMYMWASSPLAIREAWETIWAKSSVPEYKNFNQLEEGQFLHLKNDKGTIVRYIEADQVRTRATRSRTTTGTGWFGLGTCVECGDDKAIRSVPDSYKEKDEDGNDKLLFSWEIPLCRTCVTIDPAELTYRHCDRELKMKATTMDKVCVVCEWFPMVTYSKEQECQQCYQQRMETERKAKEQERIERMKSMGLDPTQITVKCADCDRPYSAAVIECREKDGALVCRGCLNPSSVGANTVPPGLVQTLCVKCKVVQPRSALIRRDWQYLCRATCHEPKDSQTIPEKQEIQRTLQGAEAKQFLELHPGDRIPANLYDAWSNCSSCGHNNVRFIGKDGNAICTACAKIAGFNTTIKVESKKEVDSLQKLQAEVQAREIADDPDNNPMYEKCIACTDAPWTLVFELNETAWGLACDECYTSGVIDSMSDDACTVESNSGTDPWSQTTPIELEKAAVEEAEMFMRIKIRACVETGWELEIPGHYVMWCVDECDVSMVKDKDLQAKIKDIIDRYGDNQWLVETLIRNGRDDLVPSNGRLTEEAVSVAVGFTKGE